MSELFGGYNSFFRRGFGSHDCIFADSVGVCLTERAEDRFKEAVYFASHMESGYHDPQKFRYALGAFLSAYASVSEIMRKELEFHGRWGEWKEYIKGVPESISVNEYDPALTRARNINIHQKSVFAGSYCEIGLYRGSSHKLSLGKDIDWDISSAELIDRFWDSDFAKLMLDVEHSAYGEQYGVRRIYRIRQISSDLPESDRGLDIVQIVRRALLRLYDRIGFAHTMDGEKVELMDGGEIVNDFTYNLVTILLESDVNPDLPKRWGWPDLGEELWPVSNF